MPFCGPPFVTSDHDFDLYYFVNCDDTLLWDVNKVDIQYDKVSKQVDVHTLKEMLWDDIQGFVKMSDVLLVHHVLCKMWPALETKSSNYAPLEKKCFEYLKSYLVENVDCTRKSMERFLDAFDPITSTSPPPGVFSARNEGSDFECAPISLLEHVITFLNDVRDDLRNSIAKDAITIETESLAEEMPTLNSEGSLQNAYDISFDFQKKITLYEIARQAVDSKSDSFLSDKCYKCCR